MKRRTASSRARSIRALGGILITAGGLFSLAGSPRPAAAQVLSGFDVFRSNCVGCHELPDPEETKHTKAQWDEILTRMVKVRGATLSKTEYTAVLNYLDSFNRPRREVQWLDAPAKTHKTTLSMADQGKLPAEWVDLTVGADEHIPWAVQADAATKSAYLSPLKTAGESQFPTLIDNTGIVQNGTATTRLQIVSGKGALGAGIVFGFKNPQSYYGVRLSGKDVVLYQVDAGRRSLRARTAAATPLKQWLTLSVDVTGKAVKVTLNGKPLPELDRALEDYRGGRMGVHTQGDTVALFDQWQVAVK